MSFEATRWAWEQDAGKASAKLVLLRLADHANDYHEAHPSIAGITAATELDRKTVMKAMTQLQERGLIKADKRHGALTVYRLAMAKTARKEDRATSTKTVTSTEIGTSTKNGHDQSQKRHPNQSQKRDTNLSPTYQEPINQQQRAKSEPKAKGLDTSKLPPNLMPEVWADYRKHRKAIKAPITTQTGVNRIAAAFRRVEAAGYEINEAVAEAIDAGWRGIEPEWLDNRRIPKQRNHHNAPKGGQTHEASRQGRGGSPSRAKQVSDRIDQIAREDAEQEAARAQMGSGDLQEAAGPVWPSLDLRH